MLEAIVRRMISYGTTSFFINGPPGSGKSHALERLRNHIQQDIPGSTIFGPYRDKLDDINQYCQWIISEIRENGYMDETPTQNLEFQQMDELWNWLARHIVVRPGKHFIVMLDVQLMTGERLAQLFSFIRSLQGAGQERSFKLHHVIAGYWNHEQLNEHYRRVNVSFPYTFGDNYTMWEGIKPEDVIDILPKETQHRELYGRLLYEVTGGYPGVVTEIIRRIPRITVTTVLKATQETVTDGEISKRIVQAWQQLPDKALSLVRRLLVQRYVRVGLTDVASEHLLNAGLAQRITLENSNYIRFRSWYSELLVRHAANDLGLRYTQPAAPLSDHLIPELVTINEEAFRLIHSIEVSARNLVATQLWQKSDDKKLILKGQLRKLADGKLTDAHERAKEWRNRSKKSNLNTQFNPLMAYFSTRDLADLMRSLDNSWLDVAQSIDEMAVIRDAVMHHQLIDENSLETLYSLQQRIFDLLDRLGNV